MNNCKCCVGLIVLGLAFLLTSGVGAQDAKADLSKVPAAVKDAVKAKFPKAKVSAVSSSKDGDKTVYEISLKENEKNIDVSLSAEGKILVIEREIEYKDLPKAVASAFDSKYPKAKFKRIEELTKDDKVTAYEAIIVTTDNKTLEVEFEPSGKFVAETPTK